VEEEPKEDQPAPYDACKAKREAYEKTQQEKAKK